MKLFLPDPPTQPPGPRPSCTCLRPERPNRKPRTPALHDDAQDTTCAAWAKVLRNVELAEASGQAEFAPLDGLTGDERSAIVALPPSIGNLVHVTKLQLYGSNLVRLPPQIGAMRSLADLDVYTSYRLHFLPYEIVHCSALRDSRVSTRALFGNHRYRPPFPDLLHTDNAAALELMRPRECSVCRASAAPPSIVRWLTLRVGTDTVPLLAYACSKACIAALPHPPEGYIQRPHTGGTAVPQPPPRSP